MIFFKGETIIINKTNGYNNIKENIGSDTFSTINHRNQESTVEIRNKYHTLGVSKDQTTGWKSE